MDIKALKDKILQLAIQGKLVAQNENDEPASVLLERIKAEKEQLIKEKVIKKEKLLDEVKSDEKLFDLPRNWMWAKMGEIGNWSAGSTPLRTNKSYYNGNIPWIKTGELNDGYICDSEEKITEIALHESSLKLNPIGSVLIAMYGATIGKLGILEVEATTNQACCACITHSGMYNRYLFYVLLAMKEYFKQGSFGGAQPNISKQKIINTPMPLPPIEEQKRIVAKVDSLFKLIDELDNNKQDFLQNISDSRNKVLQLAIKGKLVSQDENEEPASVLLEKIKEEKEQLIKDKIIKKEKPLAEITEVEKSFELTNGWEWCRFGQATICRDGDRIPVSTKDRENRAKIYDYYGASGVIDKIDGYLFDKPLLLIGEDGANLISRSTPIAFIAEGKYWVNNHAHVIDTVDLITLKYLEIYINAIDLKPYVTGTAQPKLNQANLNKIVISLPPLEEQKRIVAKVDAVMKYLDMLEKELN